mmetsp:Transcript_26276/g.66036  ORF Transcript_26276/g.66036 Transcript_26276/m.66036 type:complete len:226 (+) Transcript_26276:1653-2330(+)
MGKRGVAQHSALAVQCSAARRGAVEFGDWAVWCGVVWRSVQRGVARLEDVESAGLHVGALHRVVHQRPLFRALQVAALKHVVPHQAVLDEERAAVVRKHGLRGPVHHAPQAAARRRVAVEQRRAQPAGRPGKEDGAFILEARRHLGVQARQLHRPLRRPAAQRLEHQLAALDNRKDALLLDGAHVLWQQLVHLLFELSVDGFESEDRAGSGVHSAHGGVQRQRRW